MADDVTLKIGADTKGAQKAFENLEKSVEKTGKDIQKVAKKSTSAWATFKGVLGAQVLVGGLKAVSKAAVGMGKSLIDAAKDMETIETELTTVTGSAEKAQELLEELTDFAATTPFQLEGIAKATKQLIAFGFSSDEVTDKLKKIGDVAAGSGAQLSDVSLIYGQVAAAGKLTGERLLQFQERAIPIGPAIAKTMGIAEDAVKDTVSKGKVSLEIFEKAFASLSAEGGIFFESMIDKSETFDGVMSTLGDNISLLAADMGKQLLPAIKEVAKALISFIQENKQNMIDFFKSVLQASALVIKGLAKIGGAADKVSKALGFDKGHRRLKANQELIDRYKDKIKDLKETVDGGTGFFTDKEDIDKANESLNVYKKLLLEARERQAKLVSEGATSNLGDDLAKSMDSFIEKIDESKKAVKKVKEEAQKPGGIQSDSFWNGMVENFEAAQKEMIKFASSKWGVALKKIGASLGSALTSGSAGQRAGMDDIDKIEKEMAVAKAHNEMAEYDKLVLQKIEAEKKLAKVQEDEAAKFFSSAAGSVADIFIPGAGQFITSLLELAQDPEAFAAFIDGFVEALPDIIDAIIDALPVIIEALVNHMPEIVQALAEGVLKLGGKLVEMVVQGAAAFVASVAQGAINFVQKIGEGAINFIKGVAKGAAEFVMAIPKAAEGFLRGLVNGVGNFIKELVNGIVEGVKKALGNLGPNIGGGKSGIFGGKIIPGFLANGIDSVPQGFPNDSFPAQLTSGEEVLSVDDKSSVKKELATLSQIVAGQQGGGAQTINVELTLDGNVLATQILELNRDNRRLA